MPLTEALPIGDGCAQWDVWGTVARIVVTDPDCLDTAAAIVRSELAAVDAACSRFRPDSETELAYTAGGIPIRVSSVLGDLMSVALAAAAATNGDVDPTLGGPLIDLGYDRDFTALSTRVTRTAGTPDRWLARRGGVEPPWTRITLHNGWLTAPPGTRIDLGATAKARAADRCAERVADQCRTGVLVALGGDIATAGPAPDGWTVLVQDGPDQPACTITLSAGAAIATSSTISRRWQREAGTMHHILDPRTGYPADPVWRTASVVAGTCAEANTITTAAIVRGSRTAAWLHELGVAARLVGADGTVTTFGTWTTP
jgi:FAD:protein FMN transferase